MKRSLLAVLALAPPALAVTIIVDLISSDPDLGLGQFAAQLGLLLMSAVAVVTYLIDTFRGGRVPAERRGEWAVLVFMFAPLALPTYWWRFIR